MKIYESKLAQIPGHILWTCCLYLLIAALLSVMFYLFKGADDVWMTFLIVLGLCLGQSRRFFKMRYKLCEDALVQYDFQSRTIHVHQIVSVRLLRRMKWVSIHTPYNMVIETIDRQKYFIAPEDVESLVDVLKSEEPSIKVIRD